MSSRKWSKPLKHVPLRYVALVLGMAVGLALPHGAAACGNPMMLMMIEGKMPEVGRVIAAEGKASQTGLLHRPAWTPKPGQTYHHWSQQRAEAAIALLVERIKRRSANPGGPAKIDLFLTGEFAWVSISTGADGPKVAWRGLTPSGSEAMVVTSASVLSALAKGQLTMQTAAQSGLIAFRGSDAEKAGLKQRMATLFSASQTAARPETRRGSGLSGARQHPFGAILTRQNASPIRK